MENELQDKTIRKERISDQIKSILKQSILDGRFKPGDKFPPEAQIAQKYNVSKVSAREALREMETEGLILKKRGIYGGSFVAEPGSKEMVDVVINSYLFGGITAVELADFRRILEPELAKLACQRRTEQDLEIMEKCIQEVEESIIREEPDQTKAFGFHRLIADACHNSFISALMEALVKVFQEVLAKTPDLETAKKDIEYNKVFLKCIRERDGKRAQKAMVDHFDTLDKMIELKMKKTNKKAVL
ncbi:MAG: FadR family transcriptional regulator [Desulfobacteraceae bacterium]|nr:FadR family transcriptional regulator [Desulfobacteraceae bacterium]